MLTEWLNEADWSKEYLFYLWLIMNWRFLVGLLLLIVGIGVFYASSVAGSKLPVGAKIGGGIWVTVGVFLLIKAMVQHKDEG